MYLLILKPPKRNHLISRTPCKAREKVTASKKSREEWIVGTVKEAEKSDWVAGKTQLLLYNAANYRVGCKLLWGKNERRSID